MRTVTEILNAFGGVTEASRTLKLPLGTVSSWQSRLYIPWIDWDVALRGAKRLGIPLTEDHLHAIAWRAACKQNKPRLKAMLKKIAAGRDRDFA